MIGNSKVEDDGSKFFIFVEHEDGEDDSEQWLEFGDIEDLKGEQMLLLFVSSSTSPNSCSSSSSSSSDEEDDNDLGGIDIWIRGVYGVVLFSSFAMVVVVVVLLLIFDVKYEICVVWT